MQKHIETVWAGIAKDLHYPVMPFLEVVVKGCWGTSIEEAKPEQEDPGGLEMAAVAERGP